jgi:hypothetical protein
MRAGISTEEEEELRLEQRRRFIMDNEEVNKQQLTLFQDVK